MEPLISVIVPVYKVEKHLENTVKTIINQSYQNLEIILVDDGSPDNSGKICDELAKTDTRIKVIHKENDGVSSARNTGIEAMQGEYYCFADGDDTLHPNYVLKMYNLIKEHNADISMCMYLYAWKNGKKQRSRNKEYPDNKIFVNTGKEALELMLYSKIYAPACWCKLFKASNKKIFFPKRAIGEDMIAVTECLIDAEKVVMTNEPLYYYLQNDDGVMRSVNPDKIFDMVKTGNEMLEIVKKHCPEAIKAAEYYIAEKNIDAFMKLSPIKGQSEKLNVIKANIKKYAKNVAADENAHLYLRKECKAATFGLLKLYKNLKKLADKLMKFAMNELPEIVIKLTNFMPRHNIIIFESIPSFSDNTYWFFKYLAEKTDTFKKYKPVWRVRTVDDIKDELCGVKIKCIVKNPKTTKQKIELGYYHNFAKFIVDCNDYVYKKNNKQKRIFLGHGMPLKIVKDYDLIKGEVDMNMITSYNFNKHFYDIGDKDENMRNYGYCRTDVMAQHAGIRKNRDTTYIVWMPTYRQHTRSNDSRIKNNFPLGLPVIKSTDEMAEINEFLKEHNSVLYLRPHPSQDVSIMKLDEMSNIVIADNNYLGGRQIYDFLTETDALITDYSSVYYDYLMIDRPIGLAIEDLDDFRAKWPMFYDDFKANYKCPYIYTLDELKKFILDVASDNDEYAQERQKAKCRFNDFTDGKTCERVYEFMKKEYKF